MQFQPFEPHGRGGPRIGEIPLRMVLPNLVTVLAICAGLSGIRLAFEARFETAVVMVLIAAFLDGIDGRLARMLKATSRVGAQMESLADIVNFCVAPALHEGREQFQRVAAVDVQTRVANPHHGFEVRTHGKSQVGFTKANRHRRTRHERNPEFTRALVHP